MRKQVLDAAEAAGRDPADIMCAYNVEVRVDDRANDQPGVLAGAAEVIPDRLTDFAGLGFSAFNFMVAGPDRDEQIERSRVR